MKKRIIIIIIIALVSCKTKEKPNNLNEFNFTSKKIDSLNKNKFPLSIAKFKDSIELIIYSYGEKGNFGGLYSDGELDSPVFFLKIFNRNKTIDSIEIHKKEIGEGTYKTKSFRIQNNHIIEIIISEEWEDEKTGSLERIDSLLIYKIKNNGKLILDSKNLIKNN